MYKHSILIIGFILTSIVVFGQENTERVSVFGYSIGDRVDTAEFYYKHQMDSAALIGEFLQDDRFNVCTWFDTIVSFFYSSLTKSEFDSLKSHFTDNFQTEPEIFVGERYGIKFNGKEFYWSDTNSGDEISLGYHEINSDSISCGLSVSNSKFSDSLIPKNEEEIEIINFDER